MASSDSVTRRANAFVRFSKAIANFTGHPYTFILALLVLAVWALTGPIFRYSDTWQLVINTGTSVVTFLMVFLIQNTQNRDTAAIQIKLDELIRISQGAHNVLLNLDDLTDEEIKKLQENYRALAERARDADEGGSHDIGCPPVDVNCPPVGAEKPA
ncbi:MAG TPA: low affinity iron permease family protein [Pirellulales bacterium]|jgi:low affinity Fe/Cu permease|nr:low affinity iron permease family protein [Pirellulales bacterium]HWC88438.1 low affinity iron permease family protein [Pirellulales bacterium]